jgi:hypothetical protein
MSNQTKKFLKKKERERKVYDKMLRRREAIRKDAKAKQGELTKASAEFELRNGKREPILSDPAAIQIREEMKKGQVEDRLKRNLAILEALEKEYDQEKSQRKEVNEALEAEGHKTMREKLDALAAKAKAMHDKKTGNNLIKAIEGLAKKPENIDCTTIENNESEKTENIG